MAVRQREYLLSVNEYNKPAELTGKEAIALLITRLILLNPGSDPLHPDMGVGLEKYRFALTRQDLEKRIQEQIQTYIPNFQNATVLLIETKDRVFNIEITMNDTVYVYDSSLMPVSINIDDLKQN